ncbi:MAG: hypothetical protein R3190_02870, partial [Thermoanaerobaculia bacterium]|nr:hypothetical protein [Thermoanaerobaculia bacterium]
LPAGVRLYGLAPVFSGDRRDLGLDPLEVVSFKFDGEARSEEDLYAFVQGLFDAPDFARPRLDSEERRDDGLIAFRLDALYYPAGSPGEEGGSSARSDEAGTGAGAGGDAPSGGGGR